MDAGPQTICWHLEHHHRIAVSAATVSRYLTRHGLVIPEPKKRPRSSYIRFAAEQPSECWQSDFTHYRLADGTETEILGWLDDHSRLVLRLTGHLRVTGPIVVAAFRAAIAAYGAAASTLTDNGMVTTRFSGGRNGLENELRRLGVRQKNGRPNHPQTQAQASPVPGRTELVPRHPTFALSPTGTCVARSTRVEEDGFAGGPCVGCAGGPLP